LKIGDWDLFGIWDLLFGILGPMWFSSIQVRDDEE
jgi:hypothetical protein